MSLSAEETAVLDNPYWHSLAGPHARFAESVGRVHRYHPEVSIFAGLPDERDAQTWRDLARLIGPGVTIPLNGTATELDAPQEWEVLFAGDGLQMISVAVDAEPDDEAVTLTEADAPEMAELVERTRPGRWCPRAHELGTFLGIRREGRLVALAGERLRPPGWTEISAVSTDESYRGQGLAGRLSRAVAYNIRSRGDEILLHTAKTNTSAIGLYEKLGFAVRAETAFVVYRSPG